MIPYPLPSSHRLIRVVTSLALGLSLCIVVDCHLGSANTPTRVESGLQYSSGQAEFDAFFSELHQLQTTILRAPDEERKLRSELATRLEVSAGATPQLLVVTVTQQAQLLAQKKTFLRVEMEGLDAEDEADTMVQTTVIGSLDAKSTSFVENATLLARLELRHAAKLHKAHKQLGRLTVHAEALEPSLEPSFGSQGYAKLEDVRRNLQAAKRALPLLSLQATDQADSCKQFIRKLTAALSTDRSLTQKNEPPLITTATPSPKRSRAYTPAPRKRGSGGSATPKPKSEPSSAGSGDFDP